MKAAARPILSAVRCRCYATQAAADQASHLSRQDPKVSRLQDGSLVVAVENYSPVVRLAFMFNSGSRYESPSQLGITHVVRNATNLSSKSRTAFGITKHMLQMGSDLTVTTTREHMIISANCLRDNMYDCLDLMRCVALEPAYKSWEVRDSNQPLYLDLAKYATEPATRLMESLHEAAFRDTLGNSLYIPEHKIGTYNFEALREFHGSHMNPANMALVAMGTEPEEFVFQLGRRYGVDSSKAAVPAKKKATYHGGESRIDMPSYLTHAAVVTEGASLGSKDLIPLTLLQRVMGTGPVVKYSDNMAGSKINQAVGQVAKGPFAASAINVNYSDSGLFGFYVVGQPGDMEAILKSCATVFGNATKDAISDKDLARAKGSLKASIHMALEDGENVVSELGIQALLTGDVLDPTQICNEIDKVTVADVQTVAKKVINGKPSMCAVGDLSHTPYLDQIL